MRTIIGIRAVPVKGGERLVAVFEDGSEGVLVQKTRRTDFAVCAVHSQRSKSGATNDCPEASYVTFHREGANAKPSRMEGFGDQIVKILPIEREDRANPEEEPGPPCSDDYASCDNCPEPCAAYLETVSEGEE